MRPAVLFAIAVLSVVGCGRGTVPAPLPGAPPADIRELSLDHGFITIRVDIPREPSGPKPVVVALLGNRPALLREGFVTIDYQVHWEQLAPLKLPAPPPSAPEKTWGKWLLASPSPRTIGKGYFEIITHDATIVIPRVLDAVLGFPEIDPARIGIVGTSTTGFTALQAVAHDRRLRVAVVGSACGDYHRFLYGSDLAMDGAFLDLAPSYETWLYSIEPIRHPERLVHAAILLLGGAADPVIPVRCVETTTEAFTRAYAAAGVPERFGTVILPGVAHAFVPELGREMLAWLRHWL